jgi:flagellin-like protein
MADRMYIGAKIRFNNFMDDLKRDESGVSSIVATVLLILIVVLLAAIFWEKLQQWFNDMWDIITGADDSIKAPSGTP